MLMSEGSHLRGRERMRGWRTNEAEDQGQVSEKQRVQWSTTHQTGMREEDTLLFWSQHFHLFFCLVSPGIVRSFAALPGNLNSRRLFCVHVEHGQRFLQDMRKTRKSKLCLRFQSSNLPYLFHLFRRIIEGFLLPLRHQVIQVAQLSFGEAQVQQLTDENQSQHLQAKDASTSHLNWEQQDEWTWAWRRLTIMGKMMAAGDVLMTQSRTRQLSWVTVNRWTFLKGTCLR